MEWLYNVTKWNIFSVENNQTINTWICFIKNKGKNLTFSIVLWLGEVVICGDGDILLLVC